jgi:hypothetical protein
MGKMPMATILAPSTPTLLLLAKATDHRFLSLRKEFVLAVLKRETRGWWPNRAAVDMFLRYMLENRGLCL